MVQSIKWSNRQSVNGASEKDDQNAIHGSCVSFVGEFLRFGMRR